MKAIFLDMDGVLTLELERPGVNGATAYKFSSIDADRVALLNEIVRRTGADVVISSTWKHRGALEMQRLLNLTGFMGEVVSVTPTLPGTPGPVRGHEIAFWLYQRATEVTSFVMLDDGEHTSGIPWIASRLVKTESAVGLTPAHVEAAVEILQRPWSP